MSLIKPKRFWTDVSTNPTAQGYAIFLDDRALRTPMKAEFYAPTHALALAVVTEWQALEGVVDPNALPLTRNCNTAIDRVGTERAAIVAHLVAYLEHDLLCYRSDRQDTLAKAQSQWDEWIAWAQSRGIFLKITQGLMPISQPDENKDQAMAWLGDLSDFELVAFYEFVTILGSFVLGMAVFEGALDGMRAFDLGSLEADIEAQEWGQDDEALAIRARQHAAFTEAVTYLDLLRTL